MQEGAPGWKVGGPLLWREIAAARVLAQIRAAQQRDLGYLFSGLLDLTGPLERTFVLPFSASTAAIRVSALSPSADRRALWVALRWLARRFVSFALFVPRIWSSIDFAKVFSPLQTRKP
jgi:hypothetical protein